MRIHGFFAYKLTTTSLGTPMADLAMNEMQEPTATLDHSSYTQTRRARTPAMSAAKEPEGTSSNAALEVVEVLLAGAEAVPEAAELMPAAELTPATVLGAVPVAAEPVWVRVPLYITRISD
jgi:hypothetical protein